MKRFFLIMAVILGLACAVAPTAAQDNATKIDYGQAVSGEITNRNFEIEYQFQGSQGDVILVQMNSAEGSQFYETAIIFLDADYNVLASQAGSSSTILLAELSKSGTYSLLATRRDGRSGKGVGIFDLKLLKLPVLVAGKEVRGKVGADTIDYYAVKTGSPFTISYVRKSRGFYPEVHILTLRVEGNYMDEVATLAGATLVSGSLTLAPESGDNQLFLVTVQKSARYYTPDQNTVEYAINLSQ
jgi:hypothetical protein